MASASQTKTSVKDKAVAAKKLGKPSGCLREKRPSGVQKECSFFECL
jgi:hypothetical protein